MSEKKEETGIQKSSQTPAALSPSVRFTHSVITLASGNLQATEAMKRLMNSYYIAIDAALQTAEAKRQKQSEQYRDVVPVTWANVNMELCARNVMAYSKIGLDPALPNHINLIPRKDTASGKYIVTFIEGYRGKDLKADKYALDKPIAITVEVVYKEDKFKLIKKDHKNPVEGYEFEIVSPFDRGEIVGGFYYHQFKDSSKNKVVVMSLKDIEKRKPANASVEFWGGEKDEYKGGTKTGNKVQVEGWRTEMIEKTIKRKAYNDITMDSSKIDDAFSIAMENDRQLDTTSIEQEIQANAHKEALTMDVTHEEVREQKAIAETTTPETTATQETSEQAPITPNPKTEEKPKAKTKAETPPPADTATDKPKTKELPF